MTCPLSTGIKPLGLGYVSGLSPPSSTTTQPQPSVGPIKSMNDQIQKQKQAIIKIYCEWANHYLSKRYNEIQEATGGGDNETGGSRVSLSLCATGIKKPSSLVTGTTTTTSSKVSPSPPSSMKRRLITNLATDLQDGLLLVYIVESVTDTSLCNVSIAAPKTPSEMISNIECCIKLLDQTGVNVKGILAKDIHEGNLKSILTLFFNISRYKQTLKTSPTGVTPAAPAPQPTPSSFGFKSAPAPSGLATPFSSTASIVSKDERHTTSAVPQHQLNSSLPNLSPSSAQCVTSGAMISRYPQCDTSPPSSSSPSSASFSTPSNNRSFGVKHQQQQPVSSTAIPVGYANNTSLGTTRKTTLTGKNISVSSSQPTSPTSSSSNSASPTSTTSSVSTSSRVPRASSTTVNNNRTGPRPSSTSSIPQIPQTKTSLVSRGKQPSNNNNQSSRIGSLAKTSNVDGTSFLRSSTAKSNGKCATSVAQTKNRLSNSHRTASVSKTSNTSVPSNGTLKLPPSIIGRHRPISTIIETSTTLTSSVSIPSAMASSASPQLLSSTTTTMVKQSKAVSSTTKPMATVKGIVASVVEDKKEKIFFEKELEIKKESVEEEQEDGRSKGGSGGSAHDSNGEEDEGSSNNSDIESALASIEPMQPIMDRPHHMAYLNNRENDVYGQSPHNGSPYRQHNGDYSDNTESGVKMKPATSDNKSETASINETEEKIIASSGHHLSNANTLLNLTTPRIRSKLVKSSEFTLLGLDETSSLSSDRGTDGSGTTTTGSSNDHASGSKFSLQPRQNYEERDRLMKMKTPATKANLSQSSIDASPQHRHHHRSSRSKSEVNAKISSASLQHLTAVAAQSTRMLSGSSGDLSNRPLSLSGSKLLQTGTLPASNSSSTNTVCGPPGAAGSVRSVRNSHPSQQRYFVKNKLHSQQQMAAGGMSSSEQICSDSECLNAMYRGIMPQTSTRGSNNREDYGSMDSSSTIYSNIDSYNPYQSSYMNGASMMLNKMSHHHHHLARNAFTDTESMESLNLALNSTPSHQSIGPLMMGGGMHHNAPQQQQQQLPPHPYYGHHSKPGDLICEYESVNRMRETMSASPTSSAYAAKMNNGGGGKGDCGENGHYTLVGTPMHNANPILARSGSFRSNDNRPPTIPAHLSKSSLKHLDEANHSGGSSLSLLSSTSSMFTTPEEKYIHEIRRLRRELEQANEKILTLSSQLTANAHMVAAFEQSLSSMTNRLQQLSSTSELKDCELDRLRQTIENLKHQRGQLAQRATLPPKYKSIDVPDDSQSSNDRKDCALPLDTRSHLLIRRHTFTNALVNHNFTTATPTVSSTLYHIDNHPPLYGKFQRHLSNESVNSVSSDGTKKKKSKLKIGGNNTSWIRSSFSRAFKKNKQPTPSGSPVKGQGEILSDAETIEENGEDSRSVPSSPLMSIRSYRSNNSNDSKVSEGKEAEVIGQLRKQLREKEMQMTDMRLESLTSAHQLDNLKEAMNQMRLELSNLRQDNDRLQRLANGKSLASSQSSMTSAFGSHGSSTVPCNNGNNSLPSPPAVQATSSVNNSHSLESIEIDLPPGNDLRLVTLGSGSHTLATMSVAAKTTWEQMDQIVKLSFKEHLLRVDVQLSLGITVDSLACYLVGCEKVERKFVDLSIEKQAEPACSPFECLQASGHVSVQFKSVLDSLAFDSLTPKSVLSRLITLLMESRRLILSGSSGTGKTFLAHKLAEYLAVKHLTDHSSRPTLMHSPSLSSASCGELESTTSGAIVSFNVDHKNAKELRAYLANIVEQCEVAINGGDLLQQLPTVIILDNLHHLDSLIDILSVLHKLCHPNSPYIIGTSNQNMINKMEMLQMYNFRWSMLSITSEPVNGFLNRFLRRKLLETEAKLILARQKPCNDVERIVDWISSVCGYLNKYIAGYFGDRLCIGPRLFTSCPIDLNTSQRWFTDLWNFSILPFIIENLREEMAGKAIDFHFTDPTDWIIDTFPWTASAEWSDHLNRLRPEDLADGDQHQLDAMHKSSSTVSADHGEPDIDVDKINDPFLQMLIKLKEASDYSLPPSHGKPSSDSNSVGSRSNSRASTHSHRMPMAPAHLTDI